VWARPQQDGRTPAGRHFLYNDKTLLSRGWTWWPPKVPSNPYNSVMLWQNPIISSVHTWWKRRQGLQSKKNACVRMACSSCFSEGAPASPAIAAGQACLGQPTFCMCRDGDAPGPRCAVVCFPGAKFAGKAHDVLHWTMALSSRRWALRHIVLPEHADTSLWGAGRSNGGRSRHFMGFFTSIYNSSGKEYQNTKIYCRKSTLRFRKSLSRTENRSWNTVKMITHP